MQVCGHRAVLVITQSIQGTSTNVARKRVELGCELAAGHQGLHRDNRHDESWEGKPGQTPTLLRHEDESGEGVE